MWIEETFCDLLYRETSQLVVLHVLLLIDRLQFILEKAEHGIDKAFTVKLSPLLHVFGREDIEIGSIIIRGPGIEPSSAKTRNQMVEFIRDNIVGSFYTQVVDNFQKMVAFLRICGMSQHIVFLSNDVKDHLLGLVVERSDLIGTFKHHVFEVVGDACVRAIFSTGFHHYRSKNPGLTIVLIEPHRHAIAQFMLVNLQIIH